jgi:hypothetical protein
MGVQCVPRRGPGATARTLAPVFRRSGEAGGLRLRAGTSMCRCYFPVPEVWPAVPAINFPSARLGKRLHNMAERQWLSDRGAGSPSGFFPCIFPVKQGQETTPRERARRQ